jgi:protease-4
LGVPSRRGGLSALWVVLVLVVLGAVTVGAAMFRFSDGEGFAGGSFLSGRIGVIPIEGVIQDGGRGGLLFGSSGARAIMQDLRAAAKDDSLDAIIVLINSPGGSASASHAIYQEILKLRRKKKVVACMTDMAASGGYYVASACDKIVAGGGTLTGSIGVIFGGVSYYGLMKKVGVTDATQTAGKYKDTGSPLRPMRPDERALMQGMLDDIYRQFTEAVAKGRGMDVARVRKLAEGRIYTGSQAKAVGLVDETGNFYDAVKLAADLAGIEGEPKIEYLGEPVGLFGGFMGAGESLSSLLGRGNPVSEPAQPRLYGPMLMLPFVYEMVPVVGGVWP